MIHFADPGFLVLLALPLLRILTFRRGRAGRAASFSAVDEAIAAGRTWRQRTIAVVPAVRVAAFALLVIALARPYTVRAEIPILSEGIDLAVIVDRSSSMEGEAQGRPGGPPALDLLKKAAGRFVRARANDRIALVTFSRTPETVCPFTLDEGALADRISRIEAVEPGGEEDGTAIGAALAEVALLFDRAGRKIDGESRDGDSRDGKGDSPGGKGRRAAILFTDGEENRFAVEPLRAARLCESLGVRVHTVSLALGDGDLDTRPHERIAAITGGEAFRIDAPGDLDAALASLAAMEKTPIEGRTVALCDDRHRQALVPALLLVLAGFFLSRFVYRRAP